MASCSPGYSAAMNACMIVDSIPPETSVLPGYADRATTHGLEIRRDEVSEIARLDTLRRSLGCSQSELARMIGVSQSTLSRLFRPPLNARRIRSSLATRDGLARIELALTMFTRHLPSALTSKRAPKRATQWLRNELFTDTASSIRPSALTRLRPPMADSPVPGESGVRTTYRLLIAEDDLETAALYTTLFTEEENRLRYEVAAASTAAQCLHLLRATWKKRPYDLLVMDLGIGARQGTPRKSLLDQLRQRPLWMPPHLLVVSGMSPYQLRSKVSDLTKLCAAFLAKPFDIDVLLDAAYALVTGSTQGSQYLQYF